MCSQAILHLTEYNLYKLFVFKTLTKLFNWQTPEQVAKYKQVEY